MRSYSVVILNRYEKQKLQRVLASMGVAQLPSDSRELRALGGVARHGTEVTHELAVMAMSALQAQLEQCGVEADREHWLRTAVTPDGREALARGELVSGGLIADAGAMIDMLVETRQLQLREAREALAVMDKARLMASPRPDVEDEEDE